MDSRRTVISKIARLFSLTAVAVLTASVWQAQAAGGDPHIYLPLMLKAGPPPGVPVLTIDDQPAIDEAAGTATFTVSLSQASGANVSVDYASADGTAVAPADYTAVNGTLTIPAGSLSGNIAVAIIDDTLDEPDETFAVDLSSATGAFIGDGQGVGTIIDDDLPSLTINDVTVDEGDGTAEFAVMLTSASTVDVSVEYVTADGTAVSPSDYTAASGTIVFAAGQTSATVAVSILDDAIDEVNETFTVQLSSAINATILDASGTGTILDNDGPQIDINDIAFDEGAGTVFFTVSLDQASVQDVSMDYASMDGTATAGEDYTAVSGSLTIPAGMVTGTISLFILEDLLDEMDENFIVALSNPVNATIDGGLGIGTILDNEGPLLSIDDISVSEAVGTAVFTVSLSETTVQDVQVDFVTVDNTATAPADYTATSGTLTIPAGSTSGTLNVTIVDDGNNEPDEDFFVILSNADNAFIDDALGVCTILDNDFALGDETVSE